MQMQIKKQTPHAKISDSSLAIMQDGYMFIKNRCDQLQTNIFETRLLGEKVICLSGQDGAKVFYDSSKFERKNAAPKRVQKTLFGENAIQGMDGEAHKHRKQLFMALASSPLQEQLAELMMEKWMSSISLWENAEKIILFDEATEKLCQVACKWAGVPLAESEIKERADDFAAMVDSFGSVGPRHWRGRRARSRCEAWIQGIILNVRSGKLKADKETALYQMAFYKDLNGNMLNDKMAAIELINVIRPIVAIGTYITFMGVALHEHPEYKIFLTSEDSAYMEMFVQEVRRFFPFTPFVGARVKEDFTWNEYHFVKGTLVMLDVYGIDHDSDIWSNPFTFQPERFRNHHVTMFDFIPQGGGDQANGHRCPGEGITIEILKVTCDFLVNKIKYHLPQQNLNYSLSKIPTLPESRFIMTNIRRKP